MKTKDRVIYNLVTKGKPYPLVKPEGQLVWPGDRGGYGDSEKLTEKEHKVFEDLGLIELDGKITSKVW